jgi:inorganic triphosphatase YgiF
MANEQKQQIELVTIEVEKDTLEQIRQKNGEIQQLINTFGQIYIRRKELEEELSSLENALEKNEEAFKDKNKEIQSIIVELEKDYPRGQLDLQQGTITYNPAIKEQLNQQASQQSPELEVVKE